jgi:hypothetical protein
VLRSRNFKRSLGTRIDRHHTTRAIHRLMPDRQPGDMLRLGNFDRPFRASVTCNDALRPYHRMVEHGRPCQVL